MISFKQRWNLKVNEVKRLASELEDKLAQFNQEVGELEELREEIEGVLHSELDEIASEDSPEFATAALILTKWEELGVEDLQTETDYGFDDLVESLTGMPFPEDWT